MKKQLAIFLTCLLFVGLQFAQAQSVRITGTVTSSEDGMPLPGVSVLVKGTTIGGATDANGKYDLNVPANAQTLTVSFIGYVAQDIAIAGRAVIDVVLAPETQQIEEVMVVAYGTATKSSFTGSASTVKSEKLEKIQTSSVSKALEGIAPGVQVTASSGQPGEDATIRIRGIGSINASSAPLYVVDGVPYGGNLSSINNSDIESISVLKDAAATSLYGSRAANGVIIITTKKGKSGTSTIKFDSKIGINSRAVPEYDIIKDPKTFYELTWEAIRNEQMYGVATPLSESDAAIYATNNLIGLVGNYNNYNVANNQVVLTNGKLNPAAKLLYKDDWYKEMYDNSLRQEYQLSFSGGTDKTTHYLSFGYLNDEGYTVNSGFERLTGRLNLDHQVNKWVKVGANVAYSREDQNYPTSSGSSYTNSFAFVRNIPVIYPVYLRDPSGSFVLDAKGNKVPDTGGQTVLDQNGNPLVTYARKYGSGVNPVASQKYDIINNFYEVVSVRPYMDITFLENFKFTTNLSVDSRNYNGTSYQNPLYGSGAAVQGRSYKYQTSNLVSTFNQILTWTKSFDVHSFQAKVGHESYMTKYDYLSASKEKFFLPNVPELSNAVNITGADSYVTKTFMESYLSNVTYNYDNKYFLSGSFRRDGSSKFHPDYRWGSFWSVGAAWVLSNEEFIKNIPIINSLKFNVSYGTNGNNGLLDASGNTVYKPYQDLFQVNNLGGNISLTQVYKGNKTITWEKSKNFNIGIDARLMDRLNIQVEYFHKYTDDLLFNQPLPPSSGFNYFPNNIGNMVNRGIDGMISFEIFNQKDFSWDVALNFTHYKNELTKLPDYINKKGGLTVGDKKLVEGGSIYDYYLEQYLGVDDASGLALYYIEGNVQADSSTVETSSLKRYFSGSAIPDLFGGISTNVRYKGFDFSTSFSWQIGGLVYDGSYQNLMGGSSAAGDNNLHKDALNRWTPSNPSSNVPILMTGYQDGNFSSDRFLTDASYFNIRNISLGYTIKGSSISENMPISSIRIYATADNVYLWSKRKGMDPRQSVAGTVGDNYSPIRTISAGVSITF